MAREQFNRAFAATTPDDLTDPPRFGQMSETVKDVFVYELRKFIASGSISAARREEIPTIEKYASFADGNDPYATTAQVVRKFPDINEALPHIAVMASPGQENRLSIGPPYIATVQEASSILSPLSEPFAFASGDQIQLRLESNRGSFTETLVLTANRFPTTHPISAALAVDVARVLNEQAQNVLATAIDGQIRIATRSPTSARREQMPYSIEVGSATSLNFLEETGFGRVGELISITAGTGETLVEVTTDEFSADDIGSYIEIIDSTKGYFNDGRFLITDFDADAGSDILTIQNKYGRNEATTPATYFVGLRDDYTNVNHPPKHRYVQGALLTVQIDILTDDENSRGELSDLIMSFFSFFLEEKFFTFLGRSIMPDATVANENYQIVINPPVRSAGENEFPRPGDGTSKVYTSTLTVDVNATMYLDRDLFFPETDTPFVGDNFSVVPDATLPVPGHAEDGESNSDFILEFEED